MPAEGTGADTAAGAGGEPFRCPWGESPEIMREYHDSEWGVPVHEDRKHFEFLILEAFQAGLSWLTILKRREGFRRAFADFDPEAVARYDEKKMEELRQDTGIIRNRLKIKAAVNNAARFLETQKEFGSFDSYIWSFTGGKPIINGWKTQEELPATSSLSDTVSKDLKNRGFSFAGSTIVYAHLQATGIINDHLRSCFRFDQV